MRLATAGIVIAALCAASMARADTRAPWDWRLRFGWGVTTPKLSDEDKRVSSAKDDPGFPATRFHGAVLGAGLERRLGERTVATAELTLMIGGCASWLGADWVSERGFAWTMVAAMASLGVRF